MRWVDATVPKTLPPTQNVARHIHLISYGKKFIKPTLGTTSYQPLLTSTIAILENGICPSHTKDKNRNINVKGANLASNYQQRKSRLKHGKWLCLFQKKTSNRHSDHVPPRFMHTPWIHFTTHWIVDPRETLSSIIWPTNASSPPGYTISALVPPHAVQLELAFSMLSKNGGLVIQKSNLSPSKMTPIRMGASARGGGRGGHHQWKKYDLINRFDCLVFE